MNWRAPHPCLAALYRAGASGARTAAALRRSEATLAFAALSLDDHPLVAAPPWAGLVSGPSADAHVTATLAQLARGEAGPAADTHRRSLHTTPAGMTEATPAGLPTMTWPDRSRSEFAPSVSARISEPRLFDAHGWTPNSPTRPVRDVSHTVNGRPPHDEIEERPFRPVVSDSVSATADAPRTDRARAEANAARKAVERAIRQFGSGEPEFDRAVAPLPDDSGNPGHKTFATGSRFSQPSHKSSLSAEAQQGAARPVGLAGPAARRSAVKRILQGQPVSAAVSQDFSNPSDTPGLTEIETRIEAALTRLGVATPNDVPTLMRTPSVSRNDAGRRVSASPTQPARDPSPAPRNGIERLLQQARRQNLIADGQSQGAQARLSSEPAKVPDLENSQRSGRVHAPPPDADEVARAVTDLIRREARAAGIDLKGGRS